MNITITKIQSQLPYFPGFYESILQPESDLERDLQSGMSEEELAEYYPEAHQAYKSTILVDSQYDVFSSYLKDKGNYGTFSGLSFNHACTEISKYCVNEFFDKFLDVDDRGDLGILSYTFTEVDSPKYYNYSTDKCIYELEFDLNKFKNTLKKLISDNKDKFQEILDDRHKSRSGFISFYSDNLEDWLTFKSKNVTSDGNDSVDNIMVETYLIFYSEIVKTQSDIDDLYTYATQEALN